MRIRSRLRLKSIDMLEWQRVGRKRIDEMEKINVQLSPIDEIIDLLIIIDIAALVIKSLMVDFGGDCF